MTNLSVQEAAALSRDVLDSVEQVVIGKREPLTLVLAGIIAGGHILLEDLPGLGKTLAARSFAQALGLQFARAQFTPDLLPADLTGGFVFNAKSSEFEFRPGPLFTGFLLADEINRTPPKTQAALLEAMQERQVTVEGKTFPLPHPFHVMATANPIESEGTYPLPEAQLDRFVMRLAFGYPQADDEIQILHDRMARRSDDHTVSPILGDGQLFQIQSATENVRVDESVVSYIVAIVRATREHSDALVGSSPRGSLALLSCSRALALINGRDFVVPEDVKSLAVPTLAHRISVQPELWLSNVTSESIVLDVIERVPVPDTINAS